MYLGHSRKGPPRLLGLFFFLEEQSLKWEHKFTMYQQPESRTESVLEFMRRNRARQDGEAHTCSWLGPGSRTDRPKDRQVRAATYTMGSRTRVSTSKNILPQCESPGQMAGSSRHGQTRPFTFADEWQTCIDPFCLPLPRKDLR